MKKNTKTKHKQIEKKLKKQKKRQDIKNKESTLAHQATNLLDVESIIGAAFEKIDSGKYSAAQKILLNLYRKHHEHPTILYGLGIIEVYTGKEGHGISFFKRAVQIQPDLIEAHFNLGVAYKEEDMLPEMVHSFRKVIEIGSPHDEIVEEAKTTLALFEEKIRTSEGINLNLFLQSHDLFENGLAQMESSNWGSAIEFFEAVLKINSKHKQSYGNLGACYAKLNNKEKAIENLDKAILLDPNYEPALINRELAESFNEDERLDKGPMEIVDYRKFYESKDGSLIDETHCSEIEIEGFGLLKEKN